MRTTKLFLVALVILLFSQGLMAQHKVVIPINDVTTIQSLAENYTKRSLVKFDLPEELSDVVIDLAELKMKASPSFAGNSSSLMFMALSPITCSWNANVSWSLGWANDGGDYDTTRIHLNPISQKYNNEVEANITHIIQAWVDRTYSNHGLLLMSTSEGSNSFELTTSNNLESNGKAEVVIWYSKK